MSLGLLSKLSELSSGLPPAIDFFGFLGGVLLPLPPLAVLARLVDRYRPVFSVGPSTAPRVGDGAVPQCLTHASWSALSLGSSLRVNFFFPFLIWRSRSIARFATTTRVCVNFQSMGSAYSFGILGIAIASASSIPVLS